MSQVSKVEKLFHQLDEIIVKFAKEQQVTYTQALDYCMNEILSLDTTEERTINTSSLHLNEYTSEDKRKAWQFLLLKLMEKEKVQIDMTADAVCLWISYIANKIVKNKSGLALIDPAVGTGNLLTAVINQSKESFSQIYGIDADLDQLERAMISADLQEHEIQFFHQDALTPLFVPKADLVVSDLPVGYYPNKEQSKGFELNRGDEMSFTHELFIEQMLHATTPGGWMILLVPTVVFEKDVIKKLHGFISKEAHIQGVMQLPASMFHSKKSDKCILMLQKKGGNAKQAGQALLVDLPSFQNTQAFGKILQEVQNWFTHEIY